MYFLPHERRIQSFCRRRQRRRPHTPPTPPHGSLNATNAATIDKMHQACVASALGIECMSWALESTDRTGTPRCEMMNLYMNVPPASVQVQCTVDVYATPTIISSATKQVRTSVLRLYFPTDFEIRRYSYALVTTKIVQARHAATLSIFI